jgi:hypothetical protein
MIYNHLPSGKRLQKTMENCNFSWVNPLFRLGHSWDKPPMTWGSPDPYSSDNKRHDWNGHGDVNVA